MEEKFYKTFSIRLLPTEDQISLLLELSTIRNSIWNYFNSIFLEDFSKKIKLKTDYDLFLLLPNLKEEFPFWKKLNSKACQTVVKQLHSSWKAFNSLVKKDKKAKSPKNILDIHKFHSVAFNQSGWSLKKPKLKLNGMYFDYSSKFVNKNSKIKEVTLKFRRKKWILLATVEVPSIIKPPSFNLNILALDLGIKTLASGIDSNLNPVVIENKVIKIKKYWSKQIKKLQSKISKTKKGSRRQKFLKEVKDKVYRKQDAQVKQTLHIQCNEIKNMGYDYVVAGDLSIKTLMEKNNKANFKHTAKSFSLSNIAMFLKILNEKIEVKKVCESFTTQTNCLTEKPFSKHIELKDRTVKIGENLIIDRDLNASINIMKRYLSSIQKVAPVSEPFDKENLLKVLKTFHIQEAVSKSFEDSCKDILQGIQSL